MNPVSTHVQVISRRTLLGAALATAIAIPLVGATTARADIGTGTGTGTASEEYDLPDDIGSAPWW